MPCLLLGWCSGSQPILVVHLSRTVPKASRSELEAVSQLSMQSSARDGPCPRSTVHPWYRTPRLLEQVALAVSLRQKNVSFSAC